MGAPGTDVVMALELAAACFGATDNAYLRLVALAELSVAFEDSGDHAQAHATRSAARRLFGELGLSETDLAHRRPGWPAF
jgi:hypothetical protein